MAGRPLATSPAQVERAALALFARQGYDATTVDEIAAAAGIGRRTFFRYFPSKDAVVWGEFSAGLRALRQMLRATPAQEPWPKALRAAVVAFNAIDADLVDLHRERLTLILHVPALQASSTLRYAEWREVVAEFVADRTGCAPLDFVPQLAAHLALAAAVSAYEQWLARPGSSLELLLEEALDGWERGAAQLRQSSTTARSSAALGATASTIDSAPPAKPRGMRASAAPSSRSMPSDKSRPGTSIRPSV